MDDFRKIIYGVLIGFVLMLVVWISYLTLTGCGFALNCSASAPKVSLTSIPVLVPASLTALARLLPTATAVVTPSGGTPSGTEVASSGSNVPRPSNPGGTGQAVNLKGDASSGKNIFAANCAVCHGVDGKGGNPNPGSSDGTIPSLNPIDPLLIDADYKTFASNLDLFIEHGSTPEGTNPAFSMPKWGDQGLLQPQQIADVIAYIMSLNPAPQPSTTAVPGTQSDVARPSNPGDPGPAIHLTGNVDSGQQLFADNCQTCHGPQGTGGVPNPGSDDGTVPTLNPIDPTLVSSDFKTFATNLDLFLEHGSTPAGPNPLKSMPAWGDSGALTPQQIADVISYVISLNK